MLTLTRPAKRRQAPSAWRLLFIFPVFTFPTLAPTAGTGDNAWLAPAHHTLKQVEKTLNGFDPGADAIETLDPLDRELADIRQKAQDCVSTQQTTINRLREALKPAENASGADSGSRSAAAPNRQLSALDTELADCQTVLVDARTLADAIRSAREKVLKYRLLARGPDIWHLALANWPTLIALPNAVQDYLLSGIKINQLGSDSWGLLTALCMLATGLGVWWQRQWRRKLHPAAGQGFGTGLSTALQACLAQRLPLFLGLAVATGTLLLMLPAGRLPPSIALLLSTQAYLGGLTLLRALLRPCDPAEHFLAMEPAYAHALSRRMHGLLILAIALILTYTTGVRSVLTPEQWHLIRVFLFSLGTVQLLWLVFTLRRLPPPLSNPKLRGLTVLLLVSTLVIELLGWRNLSLYLLQGVLGTALLGVGLWLLNSLLQDAFDGADSGRHAWQQRLRTHLSLKDGEPLPGLIWLRLLTVLLMWSAFGITVVGLWGYSETFWSWVRQGITEGFELGTLRIVPLNWVLGIIAFSILAAPVRWIRNEVLPGWISKSRIERGAQEAIVTISGYVGITIAAIVGLSLAGFSFTNLAIIAGALSVGIGFGLQNIVNNFISGIILLFERPIRTGDWIVVGSTEGYVRKISIRSTQIETFDRADVIVPNSELISSQVTNWMLRDPWGRVIAPVGVAYGSDVARVREVLLKAAGEHPLVMTDGLRVPAPKALFRGFGDSALNFELRCFIRNVDQRLSTISDLNIAIEKGLREAGIQIPFPQRDLHLRSADPGIQFGPAPE